MKPNHGFKRPLMEGANEDIILPEAKHARAIVGEVRFQKREEAQFALESLNGSIVNGSKIIVEPQDATKVSIRNLPPKLTWQDLKSHFASAGTVRYAGIALEGDMGAGLTGEVRFSSPDELAIGAMVLEGSMLRGAALSCEIDHSSKDGTKLLVHNLPPGVDWQELKHHCAQAGEVAFVSVAKACANGLSTVEGEVRYADPTDAVKAANRLNGSELSGSMITVQMDPNRSDQDKVRVFGIPHRVQWQELKDHFATCGSVAFAQIVSPELMQAPSQMPFRSATGEVRYSDPNHAQEAVYRLHGSFLENRRISVCLDNTSQDASKLFVAGLPAGLQWQKLKDHFSSVGQVAFAQVVNPDWRGGFRAGWHEW